jgi:SAM-dependent methyltransferase
MEKVYKAHEMAYQNLKKRGAKSWNEMYSTEEGKLPDHIGVDRQRIIELALDKDWFPKSGKALEIGCGTGHLINWITSKGFSGVGIDISETAISLAKAQFKDSNIEFMNDDFCYSKKLEDESFDFVIDGHCFHCVVEDYDRKIFLERANKLLKKDGVFILGTMCTPINKKSFSKEYKKAKIKDNIFYVPYNVELEGSKVFDGKLYMAQRKIEHWKDVLKQVKSFGFEIKMFNVEHSKIFSTIYIIGVKK